MDIRKESLQKHAEWRGKLEITPRVPLKTREDLSLAYTPGVAEPCLAIEKDPSLSFDLTRRWNLVAVITDGSAVLGLGNIGPEAGMPVMEGKCVLFKEFGGMDAVPLCLKSQDTDEIVRTIYLLSGSFGGINLEDIAAPRCFEIERRLREICDIPVFHDDQHGTAIVAGAAVLGALKVAGKKLGGVRVVINGAGSAGIAIGRHLLSMGVGELIMADKCGILCEGEDYPNPAHREIAALSNREKRKGSLADAMRGADLFIGVSAPGVVSREMVASMAPRAVVFPMANPTPEIMPEEAKAAGAYIVGTGRSDYPNQINNLLAFPGVFRGALDCRARTVNREMELAASFALASLIPEEELSPENIIVSPLDPRAAETVARAVSDAARRTGVARI